MNDLLSYDKVLRERAVVSEVNNFTGVTMSLPAEVGDNPKLPCDWCDGSGVIEVDDDSYHEGHRWDACRRCLGTGRVRVVLTEDPWQFLNDEIGFGWRHVGYVVNYE